MFKVRSKSVYHDYKTGFFCKIFLLLGVFFFIFVIIQLAIPSIEFGENILGMSIAFVVLFIGVGLLLYFLSCQFMKLAEIAEEIEKEDLSENKEI